ncbi:MAG: hypothetical protein AB1714_28375 [Acidobacteriota bacterium]
MRRLLNRANAFFDSPIDLRSRLVVLLSTSALLLPTFLFPLWQLEMYANQYPDGLRLSIYSYKLAAGNNGNDLREINTLNHYIGMRALEPQDFFELKWLPFAVGLFFFLGLRVVVLGKVSKLVDLCVLFVYFGLFSLWSFGYRMYAYGHTLDPMAAVKIQPFTPPLFGHETLANFEVYSFPGVAAYLLLAYPFCLGLALFLSYRTFRSAERTVTI